MTRRRSLVTRVALIAGGTAALTSLIFGVLTLMLAYGVERSRFDADVEAEAKRQTAAYATTGAWTAPALDYLAVYEAAALPPDLARTLDPQEPFGVYDGDDARLYHVARLDRPGAPPAYVVAEVSARLLVRPNQSGVIALIALIGLIAALASGLIGAAAARRALRPLATLATDAAQSLPVVDAAAYPPNEIGVLAAALQTAFEDLNAALIREREFTRDASHELRTPLAVIRTGVELLAATPDAPRPLIQRLDAAAQDLDTRLEALLALARNADAGALVTPASLLPLIEVAIVAASLRFPNAKVETALAVDPRTRVAASPILLRLILDNLIGNAFRHAAPARLSIDYREGILTVADDGPGLAAHDGVSSGARFGLAIVDKLCDRAGIVVERTAAASGAAFSLRLPAA